VWTAEVPLAVTPAHCHVFYIILYDEEMVGNLHLSGLDPRGQLSLCPLSRCFCHCTGPACLKNSLIVIATAKTVGKKIYC
jgi:hypothetical protein